MICTSIQHKTYEEISALLPELEMAEIRLDRCKLSDEQTSELFGQTDIPLIATCRAQELGGDWAEAERRLTLAVESGARFADLEIEAPSEISRRFRKLCRDCGTELIRSYHDFSGTPDEKGLQMALARCFRYGADIAKIVTFCNSREDVDRLYGLYSLILEGVDSLQGKLLAFGMGKAGRESRIGCLRRGAPFTYAALSSDEAAAPGQWPVGEMKKAVYGDARFFSRTALRMPASKSFAQRAILAAALAEGTSTLYDYSPCDDSESAIRLIRAMGAEVVREGGTLTIKGTGARNGLGLESVFVGESGLLARLCVPVLSAINGKPFRVDGEGTILRRPMNEAAAIMAAFGVLLTNAEGEESPDKRSTHVPLNVRGSLIPGSADVNGKGGSQLISGLLMALPLCRQDSSLHVSDPRSIPYMYITLDVLRHFGISTRSEMEGDASLLEAEDWSGCSGIDFKIKGGQRYKSAEFSIESDWSAAAGFLVAGAVFGSVELDGMDMKSIQADLAIVDVLVEAGALVSQLEDGTVCVRRAPLEGFCFDLNHAPDLFPVVSVLAAFCAGESRIAGLGRLAGKESDRAGAILEMLDSMGVEAAADGDELVVQGESWTSRLLCGRLLKGGSYSSRHDHRMAMALTVASLGADSPVLIDDCDCVAKSFPEFFSVFGGDHCISQAPTSTVSA